MIKSLGGQLITNKFLNFTPVDKQALKNPDTELTRPGSSEFQDKSGSTNLLKNTKINTQAKLSFQISIPRNKVLPTEPLELDIKIDVPKNGKKIKIPDEIDSGYSNFSIWIEHPSGEKLLHRSPPTLLYFRQHYNFKSRGSI